MENAMTTAASCCPLDAPTAIPLEGIERALAERLRAVQTPGQAPVQRACMSNLVIFCDTAELGENITAQVPAVVCIHPARVLLLIGETGAQTADLTATVCVRAHHAGHGRTMYSEQITLHGCGRTVDRLPFAVRGLVIGDLPTNLWWAAPVPPPLAGPLLYDLAEHAQQVIYDSLGWLEPARGVAASASWLAGFNGKSRPCAWHAVADLNWRRLKYWRRLLGQALDPATAPGVLDSIADLLVEHGPHAVVQAWEIVSWLASRLGWRVQTGKVQAGVELAWTFLAPHNVVRVRIHRLPEGPPEVRRIRIACTPESKLPALNLVAENEHRLSVTPEGGGAAPRTLTVQPQPLAELVARQLSDRERDPVFLESMTVARILAQAFV
jgi:glucose-6-phosphate dehydrogenase assembly protein OpcA